MRTIQEIENMDLDKLTKAERIQIRRDLDDAFHWTKTTALLSDGRPAKDVIGQQLSRFIDYGMNLFRKETK